MIGMDPRGPAIMNVAGVYNLSEIWPAFQMGTTDMTLFGSGVDPMAAAKRREEDECCKPRASTSNGNAVTDNIAVGDCRSKRVKPLESVDNSENEVRGKRNLVKALEETGKPIEIPKQDFIHVRARRGQATDSHSLAERARREKISERMRTLQDLVPGCNKVIGKALVLDEIINYIQSLQRQVEFLSMKLEAVNARIGLDGYSSKNQFTQQIFDAPTVAYGSQRESSAPKWLHMQIGGGCERNSWQILPSTTEK